MVYDPFISRTSKSAKLATMKARYFIPTSKVTSWGVHKRITFHTQIEGELSSRMENSSQHLPEGEQEFMKTDNALFPMRRNATTDSHVLKPLFIGCLTGQFHALLRYWEGLLKAHIIESSGDSILKKSLPDMKMANQRLLKINWLFGATYTTASLGVFEILTEKLRTKNNGRPLSLCEEACCGLPVWCNCSPCLYVGKTITSNVGMLASYNRSKKYLIESEDLSKGDAQICAGIISGLFAAACSHPCEYVTAIKNIVQKHYRLGDKRSYIKIPLYIGKILTPYNGFKFYSGFTRAFGRWAPYCMAQWFIFEQIHMLEKSMESSSRDSQTSYWGKD